MTTGERAHAARRTARASTYTREQQAKMAGAASARLKRQVDSILASLDSALDSDAPVVVPSAALPVQDAAMPDAASPAPPAEMAGAPSAVSPSPFSISTGGSFLGASRTAFGQAPTHVSTGGERTSKTARFGSSAQGACDAPGGAIGFVALESLIHSGGERSTSCRPYEYADYLARVATFRKAFLWFDKADEVSPPQCARYGWSLSGHETLHCLACGAYIKSPNVLAGSQQPGAAADGAPTSQLAAQLTSSHRELCPWRGNPCPDSFASLLLPGRHGSLPSLPKGAVFTRDALRSRAASLFRMEALPALAPSLSATMLECARACGLESEEALRAALLRCACHRARGVVARAWVRRERIGAL